MSEILFKSEVHPYYRKNFKYIVGFCIFISVFFSFFWCINLANTISKANYATDFSGYIISLVIALSVISLFIWIAIQWHRSYLIIYEDEIKIARPIIPKHKYVSWKRIGDIKLIQKGKMMVSDKTSFWTSIMHDVRYEPLFKLLIYLKDSLNPLKLNGIYVSDIKSAYDIIMRYFKAPS